MEGNNLYYDKQGGFRRGCSTITTAFESINHILEKRNEGKFVATAYIDLAKVFNSVDHLLFIGKILKLGFCEKCIRLLENYLNGQMQQVRLGKLISDSCIFLEGIPQASIQGRHYFYVLLMM